MKKRLMPIVAVLALMLAVPLVSADFGISYNENLASSCPAEVGLFILSVSNVGTNADSYTVSLSGDAASWAVSAPTGFTLGAGEVKDVYLYFTPPKNALIGSYSLVATIDSVYANPKTFSATVVVDDCHGLEISAIEEIKTTCACEKTEFDIIVENTGKYHENYELGLSGPAAKWSVLSNDALSIPSGESKTVTIRSQSKCEETGGFSLTVFANSLNSNAFASQDLEVKVEPCYNFTPVVKEKYYSFCENTEVKIPIAIANEGTADNTYNLELDGPAWANLETDTISVPSNNAGTVNLILFPEFGVNGDFDINIDFVSEIGDVDAELEILANVLTCHSTDLRISDESDTMCPGTEYAYELSLLNSGNYTEDYALTVEGADWVRLNQSFASLDAGESLTTTLVVSPPLTTSPGTYDFEIVAESQFASHTKSTNTIKITVPSADTCYDVNVMAENDDLTLVYGEAAIVPVVVENKGTEKSTFDFDLSGTGAQFSELNPASIKIKGGEEEAVYLYISAPEETQGKEYEVIVSARLKNKTISSSDSVSFKFVEEGETTETELASEEKLTIADRINVFFAKVREQFKSISEKFAREKEVEDNTTTEIDNTTDADNITEDTELEIDETENLEENATAEDNDTETLEEPEEESEEIEEQEDTELLNLTDEQKQFLSSDLLDKLETEDASEETTSEEEKESINLSEKLDSLKDYWRYIVVSILVILIILVIWRYGLLGDIEDLTGTKKTSKKNVKKSKKNKRGRRRKDLSKYDNEDLRD